MYRPQKNELEPIGFGYRVAAGFIFSCSLFGVIGAIVFSSYDEWIEQGVISIWFLFLMASGIHISGSLTLTGYAPWYLLSAHKPKG